LFEFGGQDKTINPITKILISSKKH